jgi:hypothetical protein
MKKGRFWLAAALPLSLFGVLLYVHAWQQRAVVTYKVWGKAGGSYMTIRYLDTPNYGLNTVSQCRVVRVPTNQLPWTTTVRLPHNSYAGMRIENEPGTKSVFQSSVTINGYTMTEGVLYIKGVAQKFESADVREHIFSADYFFYKRR